MCNKHVVNTLIKLEHFKHTIQKINTLVILSVYKVTTHLFSFDWHRFLSKILIDQRDSHGPKICLAGTKKSLKISYSNKNINNIHAYNKLFTSMLIELCQSDRIALISFPKTCVANENIGNRQVCSAHINVKHQIKIQSCVYL